VGVIHCTVRHTAGAQQTASWQSPSFDIERVGMLSSACNSNGTLFITYCVDVNEEIDRHFRVKRKERGKIFVRRRALSVNYVIACTKGKGTCWTLLLAPRLHDRVGNCIKHDEAEFLTRRPLQLLLCLQETGTGEEGFPRGS